ncbi:PRKR-interacting protein 1 [Iris pallida]|uniref:PRKR-interacting protein 1 n=1 Tax=Iris pallida TaxID=29817 RepID=A0AAX6HIT6_IRIPA|nr:PRKR-interacting protein 1 [Iris pallida]
MRRKEQDRVTRMDADYQRRKELAEFNMRREERLKAAEERTAKKRLNDRRKSRRRKRRRAKPPVKGRITAKKSLQIKRILIQMRITKFVKFPTCD